MSDRYESTSDQLELKLSLNEKALNKTLSKAIEQVSKLNDKLFTYNKYQNQLLEANTRQLKKTLKETGLGSSSNVSQAAYDANYRFSRTSDLITRKTNQLFSVRDRLSEIRTKKQAEEAQRMISNVVSEMVKRNINLARDALEKESKRAQILSNKTYSDNMRRVAERVARDNQREMIRLSFSPIMGNQRNQASFLQAAFLSGGANRGFSNQSEYNRLKALSGTYSYYDKQYGGKSIYKLSKGLLDPVLGSGVFSRLNFMVNQGALRDIGRDYLGRVGTQLSYRLANLPLDALGKVYDGLKASAKAAIDMQEALAKTKAIAGVSAGTMDNLAKSIYDVGSNSRFTIAELTEATTTLAQAGFSVSEISELLGSVSTLASATGTDLKTSTDILTTSLSLWGSSAYDASKMVTALSVAVNKSKADIGTLTNGMTYAGAAASQMGLSFEETVASMSAVTNAGIKARSTVGTGFRALVTELTQLAPRLVRELNKVGLTVEDVNIRGNGLIETIRKMADAGFSAENAFRGFDRRAATYFTAQAAKLEDYDEIISSIGDENSALEGNSARLDTVIGQWNRLKNIWTSIASEKGGGIVGTLTEIVKLLGDMSDGLREISQAEPTKGKRGDRENIESLEGKVSSVEGVSRYLTGMIAKGATGGFSSYTPNRFNAEVTDILERVGSSKLSDKYRNRFVSNEKDFINFLNEAYDITQYDMLPSVLYQLYRSRSTYNPEVPKVGGSYESDIDLIKRVRNLPRDEAVRYLEFYKRNPNRKPLIEAELSKALSYQEQANKDFESFNSLKGQQSGNIEDVFSQSMSSMQIAIDTSREEAGRWVGADKRNLSSFEMRLAELLSSFSTKEAFSSRFDELRRGGNLTAYQEELLNSKLSEVRDTFTSDLETFIEDLTKYSDDLSKTAKKASDGMKEIGGAERAKNAVVSLTAILKFLSNKDLVSLAQETEKAEKKLKTISSNLDSRRSSLLSRGYDQSVKNILSGTTSSKDRKLLEEQTLFDIQRGTYWNNDELFLSRVNTMSSLYKYRSAQESEKQALENLRKIRSQRSAWGGLEGSVYDAAEKTAREQYERERYETLVAEEAYNKARYQEDELSRRRGEYGGSYFGEVGESFKQAISDYTETLNKNALSYEMTMMGLQTVSQGLKDSFKDIILNGESVTKTFKALGVSILESLGSKAIDQGVDYLMEGVGFLTKSIFGSFSSPSSSPSSTSSGSSNLNNWNISDGILALGNRAASGGFVSGKRIMPFASGGSVPGRDSVPALLMPGEYVMKKSAVDVLGKETLDALNSASTVTSKNTQNFSVKSSKPVVTNVYVVSDEKEAGMTENDVLVTIGRDILQGGQTRQLIKQVVEGRY